MTNKDATDILYHINENWKYDKITVLSNKSKLITIPAEEIIQQSADGILSNLDRKEEIIIATAYNDYRWVNDIAAVKVIRRLKDELDKYKHLYNSLKNKK